MRAGIAERRQRTGASADVAAYDRMSAVRALTSGPGMTYGVQCTTGGNVRSGIFIEAVTRRWHMMVDMLARNWGWVALRGVVALLFGLLALFNPGITLAALIFLFGAYAIVDGVFAIVSAIANRRGEPHWVALLIGGIAGVVLGVLTFLWPGVTAMVLLYFIAAWAIVRGVAEIVAAIRLRHEITGEWMLVLAGVLSVAFGLVLLVFPGAGALALVIWIGAYAVVLGILLLALAFRLRSWARERGAGQAATAA